MFGEQILGYLFEFLKVFFVVFNTKRELLFDIFSMSYISAGNKLINSK